MASCNWEKFKLKTEAKAKMRHSCLDTRLIDKHSNEHINKDLSYKNLHFNGFEDYASVCKAYDERLKDLDSREGANKRKDRVTLVGLVISCPDGMPDDISREWFKGVYEMLENKYGDSLIGGSAHYDEIHEYINADNKTVESRPHLHAYVMPVVDGKLNAKKFTARTAMIEMNNGIEHFTSREFPNYRFMDGSKQKSKKEVEQLKNESAARQIEREAKQKAEEIIKDAQKRSEAILRQAKEEAEVLAQKAIKNDLEASGWLTESYAYKNQCKALYEDLKTVKEVSDGIKLDEVLGEMKGIKYKDGTTAYDRFLKKKGLLPETVQKSEEIKPNIERKNQEILNISKQMEEKKNRRLPSGGEDLLEQYNRSRAEQGWGYEK